MKFVIEIMVILLSFSIVFSQTSNELNIVGNGARSAGMGYAFTGLADDATAIATNPAGISQLSSMEGSVVGRFGVGSVDASIPSIPDVTGKVEQSSKFDLNFASLIVPFSVGDRNVVGGIAYRRFVDANTEETWTLEGPGGSAGFDYSVEGGIQAITPALAAELSPNFSLGVAANILFGSEEEKFEGLGGDPTDFSGFNIDVGVLFKASDQFSIGAMGTLPWTLTQEYDGGLFVGTVSEDVSIPFTASFGAAFRPTPELIIAADYKLRGLSKASVDVENSFGGTETIDGFWEDINSFHVGLEYLLISGDLVIPIRGGFYTNPTVDRGFDINALDGVGDQIMGRVITFGGGIVLGQLILDASFEFGSYDDYAIGLDMDGNGSNETEMILTQTFTKINIGAVLHFGQN